MTVETIEPDALDRRGFLERAGAGALVLTLMPYAAAATPEDVLGSMGKLLDGKRMKDEAGRFSNELPEIAENGAVVAVGVGVDSPMTADDHITAIHIFADGNPRPEVATYRLGPHNGKAEISLRIRLVKTQKIVFAAETSKGEAFVASQMIKVTIGGCGG